jgi:hypothetical protein
MDKEEEEEGEEEAERRTIRNRIGGEAGKNLY